MSKRRRRHHHHHHHSNWNNFASYIFAFLLSLVLLAGTVLMIAQMALFSQNRFLGVLDSNYYSYVLSDIENAAADYTLPTGIDTDVIEGVFTEEEVERDVKGYISDAFSGLEYQPDLSTLEDRLTDNVNRFFDESEYEPNEEDAISDYTKEIMKIYQDGVKMPAINLIIKARSIFKLVFPYGLAVVCGLSLLLIALLFWTHHWPHRALRFVAISFGGVSLMTLAAPLMLYLSHVYERIQLSPQYFYYFVVAYIRQALVMCFGAAAFWLVLMILTIVVIGLIRKRLMQPKKKEE